MTEPIPRLWPNSDVVIIAGGPSLTDDQIEIVRHARWEGRVYVLGVNDAYRKTDLDVLYAADHKWWMHHVEAVRLANIPRLYCGIEASAEEFGIIRLPMETQPGISTDPMYVHKGNHGGFQALNLAVHFGARRIALLGYDYRFGVGGRRHWFGDHPEPCTNAEQESYDTHAKAFPPAAPELLELGIDVINCSPGSALTCFRKDTIDHVLA